MKKLAFITIALAFFSGTVFAATAFKSGEQQTGQTKQCFYNFAGNTYTITVKSYELCPLSINV